MNAYPTNIGFLGKGNGSLPDALREQVDVSTISLKLCKDWGPMSVAIDCCLGMADDIDTQVAIHTNTLNRLGFVEATVTAFRSHMICIYYIGGADGEHASDIIRVYGESNVLPSLTNPARPFTINILDEYLDMLMVCHHPGASIAEDIASTESRICRETAAVEDILHDLDTFSMISSDSQAIRRVDEVVLHAWQAVHKMKVRHGKLADDPDGTRGGRDNFHVKRYVAKYAVSPTLTHGIAHEVGSVRVGKWTGLVLWKPALFGVRPSLTLEGKMITSAVMGDADTSISAPQPAHCRPMSGSADGALRRPSLSFLS